MVRWRIIAEARLPSSSDRIRSAPSSQRNRITGFAMEIANESSIGSLPLQLQLFVLNHDVVGDSDEVLFDPDSPRESKTSSLGTPPTPDHSKFVWPSSEDCELKREAEPTTKLSSFDSFILNPPEESTDLPPPRLSEEDEEKKEDKVPSSAEENSEVESSPPLLVMPERGEGHDRHQSRLSSRTSSTSESNASDSTDTSMPSKRHSSKLNATLNAVKQKTQQAVSQQRDMLSRFQGKGGLVGWLHGEQTAESHGPQADDRPSITTQANASAPRNRESSLFGNIYDKMKRQHELLELKLQQLEDQSSTTPVNAPVQARRSLQPSTLRAMPLTSEDTIGFDNFVRSSNASKSGTPMLCRDSRLRSASSTDADHTTNANAMTKSKAKSCLRSLSFASRSTRSAQTSGDQTLIQPPTQSALQWDAFPLEDCLADPKLAAEFMNTVLPGDEWLLTLLYSIEEYEALTTAAPSSAQDLVPSIETQTMMAITIVNRFLVSPTQLAAYQELDQWGTDIRAVITQYQVTYVGEGISDMLAAPVASLPVTLFDNVYTFVFDKLRDAYETQFRLTRQYTMLLAERKQQEQLTTDDHSLHHLIPSFDQVIESEWCCTVFFVYLFRTSHHHRLSFIMDVKFKLRRLYAAAQQVLLDSPEAVEAYRRVRLELLLICRRFLNSKSATLALPTTSPMLARLKDELTVDATTLGATDQPDIALMQRMIDKLDTMRTQTRADFKRMSFERFASFLTSSLYRDFILQPGSSTSTTCSRADDLIHLLRVNRISFHQTPVNPPSSRDLLDLRASVTASTVFNEAVATVFEFTETQEQPPQQSRYVTYARFVSNHETPESVEVLLTTVDAFLAPEATAPSLDTAPMRSLCFNFLAGAGDSTVYGAVWRFTVEINDGTEMATSTPRGICILSRYPLVDSLREYLKVIAQQRPVELGQCVPDSGVNTLPGHSIAVEQFTAHCSRLLRPAVTPPSPVLDFSLQDMFECLSITHAMRLFSLALQEKKIILVSSSYSVLLSVSEALRSLLAPLVWSHIYVPVLPLAMKGYLHCPTPFVFGLHTSYARYCELPKPNDDLAVVNLDRDSVTGGGDVYMPPARANAIRDRITALCKPRLQCRDEVNFSNLPSTMPFPSEAVCQVFHSELGDILAHLETFAFRFDYGDRTVSIVDSSNKSHQWPQNTARFYSSVLQSQAFSTYLGCK